MCIDQLKTEFHCLAGLALGYCMNIASLEANVCMAQSVNHVSIIVSMKKVGHTHSPGLICVIVPKLAARAKVGVATLVNTCTESDVIMVRTRQRARLEAAQLQKETSSSTTDVSTSDPDVPEGARRRSLAPQSSAAAPTMTVKELAIMAASRVKERLRVESNELEHSDSDGGEVDEEVQKPDILPLEMETASSSRKEISRKEISTRCLMI